MTGDKEMRLLRAIGEIDDKYVEEASVPYKRGTILSVFTSRKVGTIAASFIAAVAVIVVFVFIQPKYDGIFGSAAGGSSAPDSELEDGTANNVAILYTDGAVLKLNGNTTMAYFLTLEISKEQAEIDVTFIGTDNRGTPVISTTSDIIPDGYTRVSAPQITVNGVVAEKLPCEVGSYDIEINISELIESGYILTEYFTITPFGEIKR